MCSTVSGVSLSWLTMKSLTDFSGSSVDDSGMPEKIRLSLILRDCISRIVSCMALFSAMTEVS